MDSNLPPASATFTPALIISCEHGGNEIPEEFRSHFSGAEEILETHRGLDLGALDIAKKIARALQAPIHFSTTSRLLIDLNRSPDHPDLFSQWSRRLTEPQKAKLITQNYANYRQKIETSIRERTILKRVIHLSIHSFTPVWNSVQRSTDIGLLFDPDRQFEVDACALWKKLIIAEFPELTVDDNRPYLGTDDGLTTYLRTQFSNSIYAGIELEINQKLLCVPADSQEFRRRFIRATLAFQRQL
ncbi:N-formylglutamate amidohydrolase [Thalassoglobus neptunius]|uniref:N-formylglutamate amidohydrolase n=1 Tax=Thalassoglobus neptunius TaxID=1938619 RepID=A0A5C5X7N3_9PLAN|nr:N-formylglutamate amidohydrolase [Thalassoglobus neptunius]TWT58273.1 N-formylglutamate amidohydrolase [Thalassoglobus neptunius]